MGELPGTSDARLCRCAGDGSRDAGCPPGFAAAGWLNLADGPPVCVQDYARKIRPHCTSYAGRDPIPGGNLTATPPADWVDDRRPSASRGAYGLTSFANAGTVGQPTLVIVPGRSDRFVQVTNAANGTRGTVSVCEKPVDPVDSSPLTNVTGRSVRWLVLSIQVTRTSPACRPGQQEIPHHLLDDHSGRDQPVDRFHVDRSLSV